ncbi:MAG: glycosyltransferase [Lachnospiraceae bacterium]|nr:glycosyltransferase [Lachnospiraceae bacterium]
MNKVCVLMSTYNGEKFLKEQIESLINQRDIEIDVFVRDDGSRDLTQEILDSYKTKGVKWYKGKNLGAAMSFMELMFKAPEADYYAFCDQDDVWKNNKLAEAVRCIEASCSDKQTPVMYFSNVEVVNERLELIQTSDIDKSYNNLKKVLLSNNAIGCTIVFNSALMHKVRMYEPQYVYMHDWWVYSLCLCLGGKVVFDSKAYIMYRQHGSNCLGYSSRKKNIFKAIFSKSECIASRQAKELLNGYQHLVQTEEKAILETVALYRKKWKLKWRLLKDNSFYKVKGIGLIKEKLSVIRNRK